MNRHSVDCCCGCNETQVLVSRPRGFASMAPERRAEISSRGGKAAHASGKAHRFTSEEASRAAAINHANGTSHKWTAKEARAAAMKSAAKRSRRDQVA